MANYFKKGSKSYSIAHYKCPRCHEGDLYATPTWSFRKPFFMHQNCSACGMKYEIETGFFWGSMYVAYALSSAWMLGAFGISFFLLGLSATISLSIAFVGVIILYVWIFRTARAMWLNLWVSYKSDALQTPQ